MINESSLRQISEGCGFQHALINKTKKPRNVTARQSSLDAVTKAITSFGPICRKSLMNKSGLTCHCLDNCIATLLESKVIVRTIVGTSGRYTVYNYDMANKS